MSWLKDGGINAVSLLVILQVVLLGALISLPFGFDQRSWLGLDFEHMLLLAAVCILAWVVGTVLAIVMRKWGLFFLQCGMAISVTAFGYLVLEEVIPFDAPSPSTNAHPPVHQRPIPSKPTQKPSDEEVLKQIKKAAHELNSPPIQ
jgi:hypothetical protein